MITPRTWYLATAAVLVLLVAAVIALVVQARGSST